MHTEFRKAVIPKEIRSLMAFDRKMFRKADLFTTMEWNEYESYWLLVDGVKAGCCSFDLEADPVRKRTLYITSTGILPKYRGRGLGRLMKCWEIAYARNRGYRRIITNSRKSNTAILALNREFGFRRVRSIPRYYSDPEEATVVMELML